jgi:hypothetical protein
VSKFLTHPESLYSNATAGYEDIGLGGQYFLDNRLNYAGKTIVFASAIAMESADRTTLEVSSLSRTPLATSSLMQFRN